MIFIRDEIAARDEKIEQASEYVTFQTKQIDDLKSEVAQLKAQGMCVYSFMYVCMYACMCMYSFMHLCVCMYVCMCMYAFMCVYVFIYVCVYSFMCVDVDTVTSIQLPLQVAFNRYKTTSILIEIYSLSLIF